MNMQEKLLTFPDPHLNRMDIVFGPVPSRRLGRSLGVNNIPPKHCTYSCIYCQLGITREITIDRRSFYNPEEIARNVAKRVETVAGNLDYVTFVPDGEPTLDVNLAETVKLIKEVTDKPIAILSNASLLWMPGVRRDLELFDLVSLKLDSTIPGIWRRINRPHPKLDFQKILDGVKAFQKEFEGSLIFEVMLVKDVNDTLENARAVSSYLSSLRFEKVYVAIPTRPPALPWVKPPNRERFKIFHRVLVDTLGPEMVDTLVESEGSNFYVSQDIENEILSIVRVHPLREDYAAALIRRYGGDPEMVIEKMVRKGKVKIRVYQGYRFIHAA